MGFNSVFKGLIFQRSQLIACELHKVTGTETNFSLTKKQSSN